jgi:hypothetical protein
MKQTTTSSGRSKSQFGSRALDKPEIKPSPLQGRQGLLVLKKKGAKTGKENLADSLEPLKGFQLWFAENKESLNVDTQDEDDLKAKGLEVGSFTCIGFSISFTHVSISYRSGIA